MKMSSDTGWNIFNAVLVLVLVGAYLLCLRLFERNIRAQIREVCPSGTAARVCDRVEADMMREPFGRACVRFSRWIGGAQ